MKYTESHEWIREDGTIGITEYAQEQLGEIVHVELPKVGSKIAAGGEIAVIESTKAAADIYAPVGGIVVEVNGEVETNPSLLNTDPEGAGWLFKIEIAAAGELEGLLSLAEYNALVK